MNIKLQRSYTSPKGNKVFVYTVHGTESELAAYKAAQGADNYREDTTTGDPLFFTVRCAGNQADLIVTTNGKVVPDMSKFDQAASLAAQYGGNLGQALAERAAADLLGSSGNRQAVQQPLAPTPPPAQGNGAPASAEGLGNV